MKLTLTKTEVVELVNERSGLNIQEVEIDGLLVSAERINFELMSFVRTVRQYRYKTDQKIEAIKAVRQLGHDMNMSIGLADAKFFVESL